MILGLDFGTSTTSVSVLDVTGAKTLLKIGFEGNTSIPSVIGIDKQGLTHFGQEAINLYAVAEIDQLEKSLKNTITDNPETLEIRAGDKSLELFLRFVIERVLEVSGLDLINDPSLEVRVSSPAGWDWQQRSRLLGILSQRIGMQVAGQAIVDEPSAAALSATHIFRDGNAHNVLIFDMGGGTLDIAIMRINPNDTVPTILAADSKPIAGNVLDYRLTGQVLAKALREIGVDLDGVDKGNNLEMAALLVEAIGLDAPLNQFLAYLEMRVESLKRSDLAQDQDAYIRDFLAFIRSRFDKLSSNRQDFDIIISSDEFQEMIRQFLDPTKAWITKLVQDSSFDGKNLHDLHKITKELAPEQITDVVVVGGMAHVYAIRDWLDTLFPRKLLPSFGIEPEDLVAIGLAPSSVTKTQFEARSNFRSNFNLFLGDNLVLRAYTPLFNIQQGSFDGLFYKNVPSRDQWHAIDTPTKFERKSLLGHKISEVEGSVFHPGDLFKLFNDGFVIYPSGKLVCPDGDGCICEAYIFEESAQEVERDSQPAHRACTSCGRQSCPGICQN